LLLEVVNIIDGMSEPRKLTGYNYNLVLCPTVDELAADIRLDCFNGRIGMDRSDNHIQLTALLNLKQYGGS
jgi:hypothetical protein